MMKYEQDFIYKIIPNLTDAVEKLAKELKRYNDNKEAEKCTEETTSEKSSSSS